MDEESKRTLNDRLEGLQVGDVFPGFDRSGTWIEMEKRMGSIRTKRRTLPVWAYATAAALAGLLIGGMTVALLSRDDTSQPGIAHQFPVHTAIPPRRGPEAASTVPVPQPGVPYPTKTMVRRTAATVVPVVAGTPSPGATDHATALQAQTIITPEPVAPRPRARHLLDVDGQARNVLLNQQPASIPRQTVLEYMMVRTMPEPATQTAPASIFRNP